MWPHILLIKFDESVYLWSEKLSWSGSTPVLWIRDIYPGSRIGIFLSGIGSWIQQIKEQGKNELFVLPFWLEIYLIF